ncbi:cupin domain-containing protein [Magnetospirillum fulvum]|uniref:Cupin domain-containing protein n=1 Tax=Magnetospirillum fulvum TaxID=1082 RepID=A0A1H6HPF9_MAGFU|nr:cupin domain-containing protein [Magnetospirillum fulvum]SEH35970.1 Cupin domain-containing protein [Magnetospirillum fulvum]
MTTTMIDLLAEGNRTEPSAAETGWAPHPTFPGVQVKPLIRGAASGGAFSTLLVRIAPGGAMLPHAHDGQTEQHFVVGGGGTADLAGRTVEYAPGALMVIPRATPHSLEAGADGMVLMAVFSPAIN